MSGNPQEQSAELAQKLEALQQNKIPKSDLYDTIWDLGKAEYLPARPVIEQFLSDNNLEIRLAALQVLIIRFGARDRKYWDMAKNVLTDDEYAEDHYLGASLLGFMKRNTQDEETLRVLASVVSDSKQEALVRRVAYQAMRSIIHFDPFEEREIEKFGTNIDKAVDWDFVNKYLNGSQ